MNIDWVTVGINSAISLFLSLIVFSLGLRAGKERTDRKELREKYRRLTTHFEKIRSKIKSDEPLDWTDFPHEDNRNRTSMPVVRKMIRDGEHLELNQNIIPSLEELEVECLKYGYYFKSLSKKSGEVVIEVLERNDINLDKKQYSISTKISDDTTNYSYIPYNPAKLLYKQNINGLLSRNKDKHAGINFEYIIDGKVQYSIHIRKNDINYIPIETILNEIHVELINIKNPELDKKEEIINKLEKEIEKLKKLTKEPYSFWDTVRNTFKDFFR